MGDVGTGFERFLAARSAATVAIAPGIGTPRRFSDPSQEHLATRRAAGLFDFSFMGCAEISGSPGLAFLDSLQTRALGALRPGRIAYTLLLRDDGTVLNDATVWRIASDRYWLFVGRRSDLEAVTGASAWPGATVGDISHRHAVIAVQGPASPRVIERCFPGQRLSAIPYYGFAAARFSRTDCLVARIGYSGETGYELVTTDAAASELWLALLAAGTGHGLTECGFEATDSLRVEAGHVLFSHELATPVTPFELGLGRLVDFYRGPFRGAVALRAQRWQPPQRRLVGLLAPAGARAGLLPQQLRPGAAAVTSSRWSPLFARWLALGYVNGVDRYPGTVVALADGTNARVARLPYYDPAKRLARGL